MSPPSQRNNSHGVLREKRKKGGRNSRLMERDRYRWPCHEKTRSKGIDCRRCQSGIPLANSRGIKSPASGWEGEKPRIQTPATEKTVIRSFGSRTSARKEKRGGFVVFKSLLSKQREKARLELRPTSPRGIEGIKEVSKGSEQKGNINPVVTCRRLNGGASSQPERCKRKGREVGGYNLVVRE